ncbi:hypothetical protein GOBAR_AA34827 [Gossypium barbadense]|uniref:Uncharacterized protein n=1 Tax=Gossypium barbadense TaxID=3634 RepID=A0A2P5W429_GOSBA|nr:hypothetical protein GOBAR_AA34827 [Gossypium barbadense]
MADRKNERNRKRKNVYLTLDEGEECRSRRKGFGIMVGFDYIKEAEEMRIAMQPLELIKRVKEIQREAYTEPETIQPKDAKQTAAVDLSKRLQDFRSLNDASSLKALEEWRKRKMERARQREMEKNGTLVTKDKKKQAN